MLQHRLAIFCLCGVPCIYNGCIDLSVYTATTTQCHYQLSTGWSRVASSHQLSSPPSLAWCLSRLQKILTMETASTSGIALMAACSTWGDCRPTRKPWSNWSGTSSPKMMPLLPTQKEPCSAWHPTSQRLPSSSDYKSTWRRQNSSTILHLGKSTALLTSV